MSRACGDTRLIRQRVREMLLSTGIPTAKMAEQLDTTAYTVHRWTTMQATPCAETLAQLCRITGESPAWVLGLTDQR